MNIDWYEDFLALADTGKFTAAASMRGSSQSALSRRIQLLEGHLGATLVDGHSIICARADSGVLLGVIEGDASQSLLKAWNAVRG